MGLDQLGVLTLGKLVPNQGGQTLSLITLLAIPPWSRKAPLLVGSPKSHHIRAYPSQDVVSGALTHAGNHMHGTAGHIQGRGRARKAAAVDVFGNLNPKEGGR